MNTIRCP